VTATLPLDHALAFALAAIRLTGVFLVAPIFGHTLLPVRVRAALAVAVAWACAANWGAELPPLETAPLVWAAVREALIGLTLGFATSLVFAGFSLLGEFASIQGGLGAATVLDPSSGASSVVLTALTQLFALLVFLAIDGHHTILRGVALSFEVFPLGHTGAAAVSPASFASVAALGAVVFEVAVRLALPVTAVMFVSNVGVGILGRAIPQLNLMALQLPAHVGVTLLILGLAAGPLTETMAATVQTMTERAITAALGGG
jgi:flagellar biosynthetic protein FliR